MARTGPAPVSREGFVDSDQFWEAVYHSGVNPNEYYDLSLATGYYGRLLQMVHGEEPDPLSNAQHTDLEQARRPDVYIRKRRKQRFFRASASGEPWMPSRSTFITVKDYAEQYAAAEFADRLNLYCDTSVTISWRALGIADVAAVKVLFEDFLKCLNDWMYQRDFPTVYFFSHENGPKFGLHTHVAVYVPHTTHNSAVKEFRAWRNEWVRNHGVDPRPPSVSAQITARPHPSRWLHWDRFHYQMKGFDLRAIVRSARNAEGGRAIMLGDLIAYPWQDPGMVPLKPRVGCALFLKQGQRGLGLDRTEHELTFGWRKNKPKPKPPFDITREVPVWLWLPPRQIPAIRSFVSRFEDGLRDVRALYPKEYNTRVTRLSYEPAPPPAHEPEDEERGPLDGVELI